ncbi:uncharacterized protein [Sinocyclocheilus grahami]|uniref:uncharacterized protein n=1 Tax=Sinocyclocheilus grahami TaxID=75366 RepID=UPI0007AD4424|nr:PREDICTED: uncharacterized protein LOC107597756 [Sinocyclocheilus grahami]
MTVAFSSISSDPCYNYESLDRPWRANNESGDYVCDDSFSWNGWYRFFYNGMNIQMPETCVSTYSCNTDINLWLNGSHPQIEDGVVIREVCGNSFWDECCNYKTNPLRVKACPGNYYVYELVNPQIWCSGYCTDVSTISRPISTTSPNIITGSSITSNYDPCNNYNILDNHRRSTLNYWYWHDYANSLDDTRVEWDGWYRLFIDGSSAQMPEWCMFYMSCGGFSGLWLGGSHPRVEDGVATREIYGSRYDQCSRYRSEPIQVKACPGNYYVYKFTRPTLSIPAPVYCAVLLTTPSVDPCYNYTSLDDPWRATNYSNIGMCEHNVEWNGWYRLFYNGQNAQMPESCVNDGMCGTHHPLSLNGTHPQLEDGVVIRQVCLPWGDCCTYTSHPIRVKACPGNYYVYEFVKPRFCAAYCVASGQSIQLVSTTTERIPPIESITPPITASDNVVGFRVRLSSFLDLTQSGSTEIFLQQIKQELVKYGLPNSIELKLRKLQKTKPTFPNSTTVAFSSISSDPCYNYESLDRPWRANNESGVYVCDERFSWNGWYRLFYYGMNIQMPETCVSSYSCNVYINLWLNGSHPQIEDGVVTREVCGKYYTGNCCYYKINPIRVKACPGNYYVYELVKPQFGCSGYCTDVSTISRPISTISPNIITGSSITFYVDPCNNYNILDNHRRSTRNYWYWNGDANGLDDTRVEWDGWYRLFIDGSSAQMPEWCMSYLSCGGFSGLHLGGSHPQLEDGVVTREVYGSRDYRCRYYRSEPIQVQSCPGKYYVYKFTRPTLSIPAPVYCAVLLTTPSVDPCYNYTSLDETWRATNYSNIGMCEHNVARNGWYRLFYNGQNTRMPESCVNYGMCGTYHPLSLNGPHPQLEDGVVLRQVCLSAGGCCTYTSHPIRVKACPGNYYVYEFVKPIFCSAYCVDSVTDQGRAESSSGAGAQM